MTDAKFRQTASNIIAQYRDGDYRVPSIVLRKEVEQSVLFLCPDVMRPILWAGYHDKHSSWIRAAERGIQ